MEIGQPAVRTKEAQDVRFGNCRHPFSVDLFHSVYLQFCYSRKGNAGLHSETI